MLEFTVFIKVRIPNLNDTEREISLIVSNEVIINKDNTKTITDKKYLFMSNWLTWFSENVILLINICFGFECDKSSFVENFIRVNNLKNLMPELVEKNDPPIITKIK